MNRSTRFQALLGAVGAVAALGVAAQGCGAALTAGGAFGLSLLDNNTTTGPTDSAPRVTVTTPSGVVNDVVPIHFRLVDAEGDRASVTVEVRETGRTCASGVIAWVEEPRAPSPWRPARPGPTTSSTGTPRGTPP